MSVVNFLDYTHELTEFEESCVTAIVEFFQSDNMAGREKAKKSQVILNRFNAKLLNDKVFVEKYKIAVKVRAGKTTILTKPRLGKIVNFIRTNRLCFIAGTSEGYFRAVTDEEKESEIKSMYQRITGMLQAIDGMEMMGKFKGRNENFYKYKDTFGIFCDRNL